MLHFGTVPKCNILCVLRVEELFPDLQSLKEEDSFLTCPRIDIF